MVIIRGYDPSYREGIDEVFYLTAQDTQATGSLSRTAYYYRWTGQYLERYPTWVYIAVEDEEVLGYALCCPDSTQGLEVLDYPELAHCRDLFGTYPAHLHVNVHPNLLSRGIGKSLVEKCCEGLAADGKQGVFALTSRDAGLGGFYAAVGFEQVREIHTEGDVLLFMGYSFE